MPNIVKNTTLMSPLELLAPLSCRGCGRIGKPLCNRCKNHIIHKHNNKCPVCHQSTNAGKCMNCHALPPIYIIGSRTELIGDLIHDFKYESVRSLALPLAEILNAIIPETNSPSTIVPLPTISRHIRERGFSHTHLVAKQFTKIRTRCTLSDILIRNKNTTQVGSSRQTRLSQAASAFALAPHAKIDPSSTYILFDDVWTTGASIESTYNILKQAGAEHILVAILARS